jgi:transposase
MKQTPPNGTAEQHVREIRRKTHMQYSSEEKSLIVISGLRGEHSIAELCRREGIAESLYYTWSKEFIEAGKQGLADDAERQALIRI